MYIPTLMIEVTRKCNMCCSHCMKGDAQDMDIDTKHIDSLLDQVQDIGGLGFTGGEPTLNVEAIEYTLTELKRRNISIDHFFIYTNGMKVSLDFIMVCLKLYAYSEDREMCLVEISNDTFHAYEGEYDNTLLQGLTFAGKRFEHDDHDYNEYKQVQAIGRGEKYSNERNSGQMIPTTQEEAIEETVVLNANGMIMLSCDVSYKEVEEWAFCHVDNFKQELEKLPEC